METDQKLITRSIESKSITTSLVEDRSQLELLQAMNTTLRQIESRRVSVSLASNEKSSLIQHLGSVSKNIEDATET